MKELKKEIKKVLDDLNVYKDYEEKIEARRWKIVKILHGYLKEYDFICAYCRIIDNNDSKEHIELEVAFKDKEEAERARMSLKLFKNAEIKENNVLTSIITSELTYTEELVFNPENTGE